MDTCDKTKQVKAKDDEHLINVNYQQTIAIVKNQAKRRHFTKSTNLL